MLRLWGGLQSCKQEIIRLYILICVQWIFCDCDRTFTSSKATILAGADIESTVAVEKRWSAGR